MNFGTAFYSLPELPELHALELTQSNNGKVHIIKNEPGKQASVKIYYAISRNDNFQITSEQAKTGLDLYGEYVQLEQQQANSHPNIRLLLDIIAHKQSWTVKTI